VEISTHEVRETSHCCDARSGVLYTDGLAHSVVITSSDRTGVFDGW
jgi:hypothetical protein